MNKDAIIHELKNNIEPKQREIHDDGYYPRSSLQHFGSNGLYESFFTQGQDGLLEAIFGIAEISKVCINTGFCVWCQEVLAWYLYNTTNEALKEKYFKQVSYGKILGGTGLSNPIKAYASIENNKLRAQKVDGGYLINGTLPWVSNIEYGGIFGIVAVGENYNVAGIIECDEKRLRLSDKIKFIALNGSATKSVVLKDYFLGDEYVLGAPAEKFLLAITPAFLLLQTGIALGALDMSLESIKRSNIKSSAINQYLPFGEDELRKEKERFSREICLLAQNINLDSKIYLRSVLEARLRAGDLVLKAVQSAMLHAGSSGYLEHSREYKLLLESYFVAIVTPSVRHLYKEINDIEEGGGVAKLWQTSIANYQI